MKRKAKPKWKLEFLTEKELRGWVGSRCEEQQAGCVVCAAWTRFDLINHMRWEDANTRIEIQNARNER